MSRFNQFLHGIKVVDVSFYIPGPMASLQLADMGADVIKVEPPWGDDMRALGPRDPGGKPLFLDEARLRLLTKLWLCNGIPDEVSHKRSTSSRVIIIGHY